MRPKPRRVVARPLVSQWNPSEICTLAEAAALMWPDGAPVTESTLRLAYRRGLLDVIRLNRKVLTTLESVQKMVEKAQSRNVAE